MKKWFILFYFLPFTLIAQNYNVKLIPDSLLKNANAVLRFEEEHVVIKGIDKAVKTHKWAITILNENGDDFASYEQYYSDLYDLKDITGNLYDADGNYLRRIKNKDITDVTSNEEEGLLMSDYREKRFSFSHKIYPYTIEFEDEITEVGLFNIAWWWPVDTKGYYSVQQSIFKVDFPSDYNLRFKEFNINYNPTIKNEGTTTSYKWEVNNMPAIEPEYLQPPVDEFLPSVLIAPSKFSFGNYSGDMSTWDGYGKFQLDLNKGRNELTESVKQEVHKLTDHLKSVEEKVNLLYNYLQKNTRYVSIQLRIGGWQPLPANFVGEKKYGDCKALSNFMVSLLKEASVKANYVIIKSGKYQKGIHEDFPSPFYFDHVISCVPNGKDTIWLECTSQTESAGYCSYFTGNRKALMITDDGAAVVSTPHYTFKDNQSIVNIKGIINEDGNMTAEVRTRLTALQQDNASNVLNYKTEKQKEEYWNTVLDLPTYKASNISYTERKGIIPEIEEHVTINAENFASITGKRLFISPNFYTKQGKLTPNASRKFDIDFKEGFTHIDSILITIPKGYKPESLPKDVSINNKYGSYTMKYVVKDSTIELIRTKIQQEKRFPALEYEAICQYFEQMSKSDHAKMVFVKEE